MGAKSPHAHPTFSQRRCAMRPFTIDAACACHTGKVRKKNEDNFYFNGKHMEAVNRGLPQPASFHRYIEPGLCLAVFDGMGGENFGEVAAFTAARTLQEEASRLDSSFLPSSRFLEDLCQKMNAAVFDAAQELMTAHMGSTMVMFCFARDRVYLCNLGDSRAFWLHKRKLTQISHDHVDILPGDVARHRKPHLNQHLGIDPEELLIEPYIAKGDLVRGDQYLLCSDGITDMLTEQEICRIMTESRTAEGCVQALVDAALEKGGKDNITAIVCRIG